jgi:hypothetical protein
VVDRGSTFADPEIVNLLRTRFVTVALDQWYQRQQKDAEGDFYRKVATQGPRKDMNASTQGLYAFTADGTLLGCTNNESGQRANGSKKVKDLLRKALQEFKPGETPKIEEGEKDKALLRALPEGGLVVNVTAKVLGGYEKAKEERAQIFETALARLLRANGRYFFHETLVIHISL